ncbi:hypothetical protein [Streptomyces sp. NBC_00859]|uniref:hypothetical protein n=1 Tax=Streptomyces sp. NBC_00859 TaxID=2903682 RepID=UPI003863C946|nr:hypothetical protein OG584_17615 [Streptomyces sp. NBC_00859]WSZ87269.1 hypothetical protein OG584_35145 [Streptomyces sp. NBC_00859]
MKPPPRSPLKSLPAPSAGPSPAEPPRATTGQSAPKVVAEGVPPAVLPDPHAITVTGIWPGLKIRGLDRGEIPVADWLCTCGHHERARGRKAVTELTGRVRVGQCPHNAPAQNRRDAA